MSTHHHHHHHRHRHRHRHRHHHHYHRRRRRHQHHLRRRHRGQHCRHHHHHHNSTTKKSNGNKNKSKPTFYAPVGQFQVGDEFSRTGRFVNEPMKIRHRERTRSSGRTLGVQEFKDVRAAAQRAVLGPYASEGELRHNLQLNIR